MNRLTLCFLVACGLWSAAAQSQPYTFTTLAGLAGPTGSADGTCADARFDSPQGIAVDSVGNVFVADTWNNTIRKITPDGVVSTIAGLAGKAGSADGIGSAARFSVPWGIAVDSVGNVYVADNANHTIRKITPGGVVSTLAGLAGFLGTDDGTGINARFFYPSGVAVDSKGNVLVADTYNNSIRKISPNGVVTTGAGAYSARGEYADGTGVYARFARPWGIAVDRRDNVYVADSANRSIRKITPDWVVSTLAGSKSSGSADGAGTNAHFYNPISVAVDNAGSIYVTDNSNHNVRKITPGGVVSTLAGLVGYRGSADGTGTNALFRAPCAIAVDSAGNLYVADSGNNTVRLGFPPPSLGFHNAANRLVLSWPLAASNYVVETSSMLSPGAVWTPVSDPVTTLGNGFVLTNTPDVGARFYRLRAP